MPHLIIGLGNPGAKYQHTRHNAGFLAVDELDRILGGAWKEKKDLHAEIAEVRSGEHKIILAKPTTYMNDSGKAVAALMHRYKVDHQHTLVIYDDIDVEFGKIRTRIDGSAGGHNGMRSIISQIGTQQFARIRIGIGATPERMHLEDWVLTKFTKEEEMKLKSCLASAARLAEDFLHGRFTVQTLMPV